MSVPPEITAFEAFLAATSSDVGDENLSQAYQVLNYAESAHAQTVDAIVNTVQPSDKVLDQLRRTAHQLNTLRAAVDGTPSKGIPRDREVIARLAMYSYELDNGEAARWRVYHELGHWAHEAWQASSYPGVNS